MQRHSDQQTPSQFNQQEENEAELVASQQKEFSNRQMISQMNIGNVHEKKVYS